MANKFYNTMYGLNEKDREIASTITTMLNGGGNPEGIAKAMTHEHRTLQQRFMRLCYEYIKLCASEDFLYDGRNEASVKLAKKMVSTLDDFEPLPFI